MKNQNTVKHQSQLSIRAALLKHSSAWLAASVLAFSGGAAIADRNDKFIAGDSATVAGGTVSTWARVNGGGKVIWVGLTIPVSLAENMPAPGSGPARASPC